MRCVDAVSLAKCRIKAVEPGGAFTPLFDYNSDSALDALWQNLENLAKQGLNVNHSRG